MMQSESTAWSVVTSCSLWADQNDLDEEASLGRSDCFAESR